MIKFKIVFDTCFAINVLFGCCQFKIVIFVIFRCEAKVILDEKNAIIDEVKKKIAAVDAKIVQVKDKLKVQNSILREGSE